MRLSLIALVGVLGCLGAASAQQCYGYGKPGYGYGYGYGYGAGGSYGAGGGYGYGCLDPTPGPSTIGAVVAAGGVMECEGTFTPMGDDFMLSTPALTSVNGRFYSDASAAGVVAFPPSCVDNLVKASVKYWNVAALSPGDNVTVAAVTTLAEPLRRARCAAAGPGGEGCHALAEKGAIDDAFGLFGFPKQDGVNYRSWEGIVMGTKFGLSVYVLNQRVASVLTAISEVASTLCEGFSTSDNLAVQLAAQSGMVEVLLSKAGPEERIAALASPDDIASMMEAALAALAAPEAGPAACKALDGADRAVLFPVLAKGPAFVNAALGLLPANTTTADKVLMKRSGKKASKETCKFKGLELTAAAASLSSVAFSNVADGVSGGLRDYLNAESPEERDAVVAGLSAALDKEFGTAKKLSNKADRKGVHAKAAVNDLKAAGIACVTCGLWGLNGLYGLFGLMGLLGLIGVVPAGVVSAGIVGALPPGIVFIVPGLALIPFGTKLSDELVGLIFPNGGTKYDFPGSCSLGIPPPPKNLTGVLPDYVVAMLPPKICLPPGALWYVGSLPYVINAPEFNWPNRTVIIPPHTIILPPGEYEAPAPMGTNDTVWYPPDEEGPEESPVEVVGPEEDGGGTIVVQPAEEEPMPAWEPEPEQQPEPEPEPTRSGDGNGGHGGAPYLLEGPPPGSCPGTTLDAIPPLGAAPADPLPTIRQLFGSIHGIGYLGFCAGDYYYLNRMDPADKDVSRKLLNKDRTFGTPYKDYITGPAHAATYGYFGVDHVTGSGYAIATDAWAAAPEEPVDNHCIDTWTTAPVLVPVGGLTPYPREVRGQPDWAAQVVVTPVSMLTLGDTSDATVAQKYDAAYRSVNVEPQGGAYGLGMVNSDPMLMLQSADPVKIGVAVTTLVASAKALGTLSLARTLYECREGAGARLSNELFNQWAQNLLKPDLWHSPSKMTAALEELCLTTCARDAVAGLMAIHKQLGDLANKYKVLGSSSQVPITLHSDLVRLTKLGKVGQVNLVEAVKACCGGGGSGPFEPFTSSLEELLSGASVNVSAIAAAVVTGGDGGGLPQGPPATKLVGRVMDNGGVKDCKGTYEALLTGDRLELTTDGLGGFEVDNPQLALYRFSNALPGSACRDAITGAVVRFPMSLHVPPVPSTAINPVSLLTVPAAEDGTVARRYNGRPSDGRAPHFLWTHAFKLFDYDANELGVDFLTYIGDALTLGKPIAAALMGTNSQVMAAYSSSLELMEPLLGSQASVDDIGASVVRATYDRVNGSWASGGDGSRALTEAGPLSDIYSDGYTAALPAARRRSMRRLHDAAGQRSAEELKPLFDAVARVVAATNQQLQIIINAAKAAWREGRDYDSISALVQITAISAVQQIDLATAINELAARIAADPSLDVAAEASKLEAAFSGTSLTSRIDSKSSSIPEIVKTIQEQTADLGKPPSMLAKPTSGARNTAGIIAGTVVGFGVVLGLVVLGLFAMQRRRRAAGAAGAAAAAGKSASGAGRGDGGGAGGSGSSAGPVGEGAEGAAGFYQQRSLRAVAALQRHASTDANGAAPKVTK
ncbi:MAG: hypothetical protein J3K34DRAFT_129482 [Monoraphidium minutum]|nr:MAG: hypothetical protein J3K34DRAFT_129482 [Monoraphidium minutum]